MKASEVHNLKDKELVAEEARLREELYKVRAKAVTEKIDNPRQMGNLRRDIARILTERTARQSKAKG